MAKTDRPGSDFFAFLKTIPPYDDKQNTLIRLAQRQRLIVDPFRDAIEGARVLDLACHDGRWSYALAAAGAREVIGIEARPELVARFDGFPDTADKARVTLQVGDIFDALEAMAAAGEEFDVVALYGIFYHVMDHMRLLRLCRALGPGLIIIDSEFIEVGNAMIQVLQEETGNELNAIPATDGLNGTVVGVPSRRAMEFMAEASGYDVVWIDKDLILGDDRRGMKDYFRDGRKVRSTCALVPAG